MEEMDEMDQTSLRNTTPRSFIARRSVLTQSFLEVRRDLEFDCEGSGEDTSLMVVEGCMVK